MWKKASCWGGGLLSAFGLAAACGGGSQCPLGYEGCRCTLESTCLSNLVCTSDNVCRDPNAPGGVGAAGAGNNGLGEGGTTGSGNGQGNGNGAGTGGTNNGSAGIDAEACTACWASSCSTPAAYCEALPACHDALDCFTDCLGDGDATSCDASCVAPLQGDWEEEETFSILTHCAISQCADACTLDDSGDGPDDGPCSEDDMPRGSCQASDSRLCVDGQWTAADCTGCSVLSPASACAHIRAMVLNTDDWSIVEGGVASFVQTTSSVSATFNFTGPEQLGVIQYRFGQGISSSGVTVARSPSSRVNISLEGAEGWSGCQYSLDSYGDAFQDPYAYDGCWEDGGSFTPFVPGIVYGSAATQLNVRLTSLGAGSESLTVHGIEFWL